MKASLPSPLHLVKKLANGLKIINKGSKLNLQKV
jgi:hypothetical protein